MRITAGHRVPGARLADLSPGAVAKEFRARVAAGARLRVAGEARRDPKVMLSRAYAPRWRLSLFDTDFYLSGPRQNADIRFFVAFVAPVRGPRVIHPRIFYKDVSLIWRSASHYVRSGRATWIGKGDVRTTVRGGYEITASAEETTNLPLEIQGALDAALVDAPRIVRDTHTVARVLRRGAPDRIAPFEDFSGPRRRAQAVRANLINGGRRVARFARRDDPGSLVFARGYAPDFRGGRIEISALTSRLYGGDVERHRIASRNAEVQYMFFKAPKHVWIGDCQATTAHITSYGVRSIDAWVDEELLMPGFEYHLPDADGHVPDETRQVPAGFEGPPSPLDPTRVDTSPWLDRVPVIRQFRAL